IGWWASAETRIRTEGTLATGKTDNVAATSGLSGTAPGLPRLRRTGPCGGRAADQTRLRIRGMPWTATSGRLRTRATATMTTPTTAAWKELAVIFHPPPASSTGRSDTGAHPE